MTRASMRITTTAATTPPIKPELVDEWPGASGGCGVVLEDGTDDEGTTAPPELVEDVAIKP